MRRVEVLGLGERPAAGRQAGPDPGHVGILRLVVIGDGGDGALDRLSRPGVALLGQFFRDLVDLLVGQLAAQQGEERDVVDVGDSFGIAGPQPSDDRAQEPLVKSKDRAVMTTRTRMTSFFTEIASLPGLLLSRLQLQESSECHLLLHKYSLAYCLT